jgi:hypothetical protein
MRKISILEENYMALEGNIAKAIDKADEAVGEAVSQTAELIDSLMARVGDRNNFRDDPEFINFRNDPSLGLLQMPQTLSMALARAVDVLKDVKVISLDEAAQISKAYAKLVGLTADSYNDEVEEAVFFFGRENTDIPDSAQNVFIVQITEAAKQTAIEKLVEVQSVLASSAQALVSALERGDSRERLQSALEKISIVKVLLDPLMSKGS